MTTASEVSFASEGPGGTLSWHQRDDGVWKAHAAGGHFDVMPLRGGGLQTFWMPTGGRPHNLGRYQTLGGAFGAARAYADGDKEHAFARHVAAEAPPAAEECPTNTCSHAHPSSVPTTPCLSAEESCCVAMSRHMKGASEGVPWVSVEARKIKKGDVLIATTGRRWHVLSAGSLTSSRGRMGLTSIDAESDGQFAHWTVRDTHKMHRAKR